MQKQTRIITEGFTLEDLLESFRELIREEILHSTSELRPNARNRLLTREQVCAQLHISLPTFHRWCKQGKLKVHKVGGRILVKSEDVDMCLKEVKILKYRAPP